LPEQVGKSGDVEIGKVVLGRGVLVLPGDAAAFADAIIRLAESPKEWERLGKAARELALKYLERK
jgi:colanic acid biosynthesis glycosyl transferase WcaI